MVVSALEQERNKQNLRTYYKLDSACRQLRDAIHTIYEHAFSNEKLQEMAKSSNEIERAMATSPIMSIASYIQSIKSSLDIESVFEFYKYDNQAVSPVDSFMERPILSDMRLEDATSFKRKPKSKMTPFDKEVFSYNQRLKFLGESWLDALICYNLYHKYPDMYSFNLSKMRDMILEKHKGSKTYLADKLNLTGKKFCDPESYIGALVIDRYAFEFEEISKWLGCLDDGVNVALGAEPTASNSSSVAVSEVSSPSRTPTPANYLSSPKDELEELLQGNKLNERLRYVTAPEKPSFTVQVKLGEFTLGEGFAKTIKEADMKAAESALSNRTLLTAFLGETPAAQRFNSTYSKSSTKWGPRRASEAPSSSFANQKTRSNAQTSTPNARNFIVSNTARHASVDIRSFSNRKNEYPKTDAKSSRQSLGPQKGEISTVSPLSNSNKKDKTKSSKQVANTKFKPTSSPAPKKIETVVTKPQRDNTKMNKDEEDSITKEESPSPIQHLDFSAIQKLQNLLLGVDLAVEYAVSEKGDEFEATCTLAGTDFELGTGLGKTKRLAQIIAASNALDGDKLKEILD